MIRKTVKTLWKLFQVWRLECSLYTHHRAGVLSEIYLFIFTFISWSFTEIAEWIFVTGALSGWSRKWGSFRKIIKVEKKCGKLRVGGFKKGQFSTLFKKMCKMYVKWSNLTRNANKILSKICHLWPHTYKLGKVR